MANYAFFQSPSSTPYNEDGTLNNGCGVFGVNPLYEREHSSDVYTLMKAFNTIKLTYNIWDKLNLSEKIAYDYAQGTNDVLWDRHSNNGAPGGVMQRIVNRNDQLNTQTQLSYINSSVCTILMPCLVLKHKIRNMLSTTWQAKTIRVICTN